MSECQKQESGSASDFDALMAGTYPETHEGLCMITCFNEKVGIVSINYDDLR